MPSSSPVISRPEAAGSLPRVRVWALVGAFVVLLVLVVDIHWHGPLDHLDHRIGIESGQWDLRDRPAVRWPLTVVLAFGQRGVVLTASTILGLVLVRRAHTYEPVVRLAVAVITLVAVGYGFKYGLARDAPIQFLHKAPGGHGASFPSGHMANAVLLWGWAEWSLRRWPFDVRVLRAVRVGRWIAPGAVVVAMTLLNYHWLTDFVGGAAVGVILLALTLSPAWTVVAQSVDRRVPLPRDRRPQVLGADHAGKSTR